MVLATGGSSQMRIDLTVQISDQDHLGAPISMQSLFISISKDPPSEMTGEGSYADHLPQRWDEAPKNEEQIKTNYILCCFVKSLKDARQLESTSYICRDHHVFW